MCEWDAVAIINRPLIIEADDWIDTKIGSPIFNTFNSLKSNY